MKENAIRRIQQMGKAGVIISRILFVFVCIGAVGALIAAVVFAILPNDFFSYGVKGDAWVNVRLPEKLSFVGMMEDEVWDLLEDEDLNADVRMNLAEFEMTNVVKSEDGVRFLGSGVCEVTIHNMTALMVLALICLVLTGVSLQFAIALCKAFRDCRSPFDEVVIKRMQYLAYSLIPGALFSFLANGVASGVWSDGSVNFEVNPGTVFTILIILALTYVFKYGAILQQESDETL